MGEPDSVLPATKAYPAHLRDGAPDEVHEGHGRRTETPIPHAEDTDPEPAADLPHIPGYHVIRAVGGGGMGTVFEAVHLKLNRVVALKVINTGWAAEAEFRARFDREVKTLAAVEHPNIVPVYDAGTWQGLAFLTMKFVPGKTLYHRMEAVGRDPGAAAGLVARVARAVEFLHARGIIHRDLKPLNILLAEDGTPLVADFGLVRSTADDSDLSMTVVPLGTRPYMSPEQTRGGRTNYTPACDIWALGVILYELLAGHRPFAHDDPVELFARIRHKLPPAIPPARGAPAALEAVARKCLEKNPADRYPTAGALADDLERWLGGAVVSAPLVAPVAEPVPAAAAPARPRRARLLAYACAAAAVVLAVAAAGGAFRAPQGPPPPTDPGRTRLDRFNAGEPVAVTDANGKPLGERPVVPPGMEAGTRTRDGRYEFFANSTGIAPLCDEFPIPYRVTADLGTSGGDRASMLALYAGRKAWNGGPALNQSFLLYGLEPGSTAGQVRYYAGYYWWDRDTMWGHGGHDERRAPRPGVKPGELYFTPVEIEVRHDRVVGRVAGHAMVPITAQRARNSFAVSARLRPGFENELFREPAFGTGVGLYLRNIEGIAANATVSKIDP